MNTSSLHQIRGFTLLEMTVVLLLMTLLASVAIRETNGLSFQVRYEQTRERLERIREAILGNPRQIINGQQAVSGFVADMGRLPENLHELLEQNFCSDQRYSVDDCVANGGTPITQQDWDFHSYSGLWYGWRGPYLNISGSALDDDAFTDGWGRMAQDYCTNVVYIDETACTTNGATWTLLSNDNNYGWWFFDLFNLTNNASDSGNLIVQSFGKNHQKDNSIPTTVDYENDYPSNSSSHGTVYYPNPVVHQQDWRVDISGGISVNIAKQFGANKFCGFTGPSPTDPIPQSACENAGGTWGGTSCTFGQNSCKSVGGKWNSCFFTPSACSAAGGAFQAKCQFTEKSCNAAGSSGSWDTTNRTCLVLSDQTKCENAGGSWNETTNRCDFSESSCALAGGAWMMDCEFTEATCPDDPITGTPGVTWETSIKPDSCNFTQTACTTLNGISVGDDYCYLSHREYVGDKYSPSSCDAAGGSWTKRICLNVFYRSSDTSIARAPSNPVSIEENGGYQTLQFSIPDSNDIDKDGITDEPMPYLPMGPNAIGIYEYDGDCDLDNPLYPADRQSPIQVDFHPHTGLPVINW